jgi:hypothetical protein
MKLVIAISAALLCCASAADAANFSFDFSGSYGGNTYTAIGNLITADTTNQFGGYDVTGITGNVNGASILGLDPDSHNLPGYDPFYSNADFIFDNSVYAGPVLGIAGLAFYTSAADWNIGQNAPGVGYIAYHGNDGSVDGASGALSVEAVTTSVPEASTWALMIMGLGFIGGFLRRGRRLKNWQAGSAMG